MRYRIFLLVSTLALASCNTRPELSSAELKNYDLLLKAPELMIEGNKLRNNAREFMVSELGVTGDSVRPETFDKAAAERNLKCLKEQREQRVPSGEGLIFCSKTAPLPTPSMAP